MNIFAQYNGTQLGLESGCVRRHKIVKFVMQWSLCKAQWVKKYFITESTRACFDNCVMCTICRFGDLVCHGWEA